MPEPAGRRMLVAGATGLVGRECVLQVLADPGVAEVVALVRRAPAQPPPPGSKLRFAVVPDFSRLGDGTAPFAVDQVICALGATMARAGSEARFREIDHDYALAIARLARAAGARHFLLVSALGANARSRLFYPRTKGELEAALQSMDWPALTIIRPSWLRGEREEFRLGEELAKGFGWAMPRRYRPVHARDVAGALVHAARADLPGCRVIESQEIGRG